MQQFETPEIKCRPDGSIDTAHYMKIGRQERADQAFTLAKMAIPKRGIFSFQFWSFRAAKP
jgi:hypothetical protein